MLARRGEITRQQLIEAAVEVFAELGFEAAPTRTMLERAHSSRVSISYYFGSKRGLSNATAEYLATGIGERVSPACERARLALSKPSLARSEVQAEFSEFLGAVIGVLLDEDTPVSWGQLFYGEQLHPSNAFEIMYSRLAPVLNVGLNFVSRLSEQPINVLETHLQFLLIVSTAISYRTNRALMLRIKGWNAIGDRETRMARDTYSRIAHAIFADNFLSSGHWKQWQEGDE